MFSKALGELQASLREVVVGKAQRYGDAPGEFASGSLVAVTQAGQAESAQEWEEGIETASRGLGIDGIEIPFAARASDRVEWKFDPVVPRPDPPSPPRIAGRSKP